MKNYSGASYRPGDGIAHIIPEMKNDRLEMILTIIECHFDDVCDKDEVEIKLNERVRSHFMRNAIIRTILFIPELVLSFFMHGRKEAFARYEMQCLYWAFIRGKIDEKDVEGGSSVLALELMERLKK